MHSTTYTAMLQQMEAGAYTEVGAKTTIANLYARQQITGDEYNDLMDKADKLAANDAGGAYLTRIVALEKAVETLQTEVAALKEAVASGGTEIPEPEPEQTGEEMDPIDAVAGMSYEKDKYYRDPTNKEVKTGTLPVHNVSIGSYIDFWTNSSNGQKYIDINKIPEGIYESTGAEYSPQVRAPAELFGNAAASQVLAGVTFTSQNGAKIPGTMPNQGAKTAALNAGGSYTIPAGYHNGSGKVTANSLASQTDANAAAGNILTGKTAWVKGAKITGTMANRGAPNQTLGIGGSYSLSAGYYSGGKISAKGSFGGSGSGNKNGGETDIHRDGNNIVAKGYTVSSASASISGKTVTVNVHAHFRLNNNGNVNVPNGDLSSVDYSFSFNIG